MWLIKLQTLLMLIFTFKLFVEILSLIIIKLQMSLMLSFRLEIFN
jgi:hypothetical protein